MIIDDFRWLCAIKISIDYCYRYIEKCIMYACIYFTFTVHYTLYT